MSTRLTPEQLDAIGAYWAARTRADERIAYDRMIGLGLEDGYAAQGKGVVDDLPNGDPSKGIWVNTESVSILLSMPADEKAPISIIALDDDSIEEFAEVDFEQMLAVELLDWVDIAKPDGTQRQYALKDVDELITDIRNGVQERTPMESPVKRLRDVLQRSIERIDGIFSVEAGQ